MLEKSEIMAKLTALSKKELLQMIEDLKIKPEECSLDTNTHAYTLYKLDDITKNKDGNKDPRKYFKMAFYSTVGFNPLTPIFSFVAYYWAKAKVSMGMVKTDPKDESSLNEAQIVAEVGDFSRLYQLGKPETIVGKKALDMELFSAYAEYKDTARMKEYNIAYKKKAITFDSAAFSEKLLQELLKRSNFSLRVNSEVNGFNYNTETGVVESVRILGKSGKDVKCDALVLCTGA